MEPGHALAPAPRTRPSHPPLAPPRHSPHHRCTTRLQISGDLDDAQRQLEDAQRQLAEAQSRLAEREAALNEANAQMIEVRAQLASKENEVETSSERLAGLQASLQKQVAVAEAMEATLAEKVRCRAVPGCAGGLLLRLLRLLEGAARQRAVRWAAAARPRCTGAAQPASATA